MSNQSNNRLKPIVKASQNARKNKIMSKGYSFLLMSALATGALVAPAMAENNPNNVFSTTSTPTTATTGSGSSVNGASSSGLTIATNSTSGGGQASGVQAGSYEPPYGALPGEEASLGVVNDDVIEDAKNCADPENPDGLKAEHERVYQERISMAVIQTDTDKIFEKPKEGTELGVAGCFTASTQIIDLARSIPSITPSWGNIGTIVRKAVENRIQKAQAEIFERGCAIANKALAGAIAPINEQLSAIAQSNAINDPTGFLGNYLANITGQQLDEADLAFNGVLDNIENKINQENQSASEQLSQIGDAVNDLDNALNQIGGYDTSAIEQSANDAQNGALSANVQRAQALVDDVKARKPASAVMYHDDGDIRYCKRVQNNDCTDISYSEYRELKDQMRNWRYENDAAHDRLNAAKKSLGQSGSSSSVASSSNTDNPDWFSGSRTAITSQPPSSTPSSNTDNPDWFSGSSTTTTQQSPSIPSNNVKTSPSPSSNTENPNSFNGSSTTNNPDNVFAN